MLLRTDIAATYSLEGGRRKCLSGFQEMSDWSVGGQDSSPELSHFSLDAAMQG